MKYRAKGSAGFHVDRAARGTPDHRVSACGVDFGQTKLSCAGGGRGAHIGCDIALPVRGRYRATSKRLYVSIRKKGEFGAASAMRALPTGMTVALTVAEAERTGDSGSVRFYPDGQSSGGEIVLGSMAALRTLR